MPFILPSELSTLPGSIDLTVRHHTSRDYIWFKFLSEDSTMASERIRVTLQIGGAPGQPKTADVWVDVARGHDDIYIVGLDSAAADSAYFYLEVDGVMAALRSRDCLDGVR